VRSPSSPQEYSFPGSSEMESNTELEREGEGAEGVENVSGGRKSEESNFSGDRGSRESRRGECGC
jgi:hypothetical protein